jgi:DNA-nicking Smr family endonuclease
MGISDDDREAFRDAVRDVRPRKPVEKVELTKPRPQARASQTRAARRDLLEQSLLDARAGSLSEEISFRRPSVSERTFSQLRRGKFSIEDEIDLHGLTRANARSALQEFLAECLDRGLGCVRIVHGKGTRSGPDGPVLKAVIQQWLIHWDDVLAFVSAQRRHGGSGAVYVLLRRH